MMNKIKNPISFTGKREWRGWLIKNHDKEKEIWIVFFKKHTQKEGLTYAEAVEEALCFGWIDGILNRIDDEKHMIRFSPRKQGSVWSKINKEKSEKLIKEGRMTDAGIKSIEEAKKNGLWQKAYTNKKIEKMPSDLKEELIKEKQALENFNKFAATYKNMYVGFILAAKTDETRRSRIAKVVENARKNKKAAYL
jgi:uncharacterized protein YdeI (YjbR/CyaY-like superfamily)